ncbi:hypothetical protein O6R05_00520 [Peptoniphilus equinus]|uniref:Lipoprotein n=1 Tax=Peptoniphilus equinus TaxID=3016343 RepID=A0ABY7QTH5_9FIRM|nr:hypothetical protein [Peptoniphilus equinus]WBW50079.1 hypothetical protein O6R05_00520 [Peptoniphilus equinus]
MKKLNVLALSALLLLVACGDDYGSQFKGKTYQSDNGQVVVEFNRSDVKITTPQGETEYDDPKFDRKTMTINANGMDPIQVNDDDNLTVGGVAVEKK